MSKRSRGDYRPDAVPQLAVADGDAAEFFRSGLIGMADHPELTEHSRSCSGQSSMVTQRIRDDLSALSTCPECGAVEYIPAPGGRPRRRSVRRSVAA